MGIVPALAAHVPLGSLHILPVDLVRALPSKTADFSAGCAELRLPVRFDFALVFIIERDSSTIMGRNGYQWLPDEHQINGKPNKTLGV